MDENDLSDVYYDHAYQDHGNADAESEDLLSG
jgi:hypothetical protein